MQRSVSPTLWTLGWRYLLRHPLQSLLMVLGITLGVAVVVAIDLANASASRAFDLSVESVAGRATHQIVGGPAGLGEELYVRLRREGVVEAAAPVVTDYVASPQLGDRPLQLLGVDPFAEAPFRSYVAGEQGISVELLTAFMTEPGAVLISTALADQYQLKEGDRIDLTVGGRSEQAVITGLVEPEDDLSQRALQGVILTDIATAQEITGRLGTLSHIDLILPEDNAEATASIEALLPEGVRIIPSSARSGSVEQMTGAFRVNLTALSLLALLVGLFLIYNTMTFSVVQRRPLFGTLRCLGVTRREVFALVVSEALIVGVIGATLGIGLGIVMGQSAVQMVTQTINDLYFVLTVRGVPVPLVSLIKGAALGIAATVLTASPPAWEAASVPPRTALSRSGLESKAQRAVTGTAVAGLILIAIGIAVLAIPTRDLAISFGGTFGVVVGAAMLTPATMALLMRIAPPLTGKVWGVLGRMAPRNVVSSLSRTSIAVAALMVAVSVTIGVSVMVRSFRHTVVIWLGQTLQSDLYISVPGGTATTPTAPIEPAALAAIRAWEGAANVQILRTTTVDSLDGPVDLTAVDNPHEPAEQEYYSVEVPADEIWETMQDGAVLVSEPLARRLDLPMSGGEITLQTDQGAKTFDIVGVYYDYASSQGTVLMSLEQYRALWNDDAITAVAVDLDPEADPDVSAQEVEKLTAHIQQLKVSPNRALREQVLMIFDRTFAITGALQMLATVVAFIGVLSALLSLQLEKQREFGILRAVGLTTRQLWGLIMLETGLMGAIAGLLAMPTGYVLSLILVYIINRRAFGWTLQMLVIPDPFAAALIIALAAALLAGIYPARRMSRMIAAEAIRFE